MAAGVVQNKAKGYTCGIYYSDSLVPIPLLLCRGDPGNEAIIIVFEELLYLSQHFSNGTSILRAWYQLHL